MKKYCYNISFFAIYFKIVFLTFVILLITKFSFGQKYEKIYKFGKYQKDWALVE